MQGVTGVSSRIACIDEIQLGNHIDVAKLGGNNCLAVPVEQSQLDGWLHGRKTVPNLIFNGLRLIFSICRKSYEVTHQYRFTIGKLIMICAKIRQPFAVDDRQGLLFSAHTYLKPYAGERLGANFGADFFQMQFGGKVLGIGQVFGNQVAIPMVLRTFPTRHHR